MGDVNPGRRPSQTQGSRIQSVLGAALLLGAILAAVMAPAVHSQSRRTPQERAQNCELCANLLEKADLTVLAQDPHTTDCSSCHNPHSARNPDDWRNTCQQEACHPRAWTDAVQHRLDAEVFKDCMNCHQPHVWALDGMDCASCHGDMSGPEGVVATPNIERVTEFPHGRHTALECGFCHAMQTRHADLLLSVDVECRNCHHNEENARECATCHDHGGFVEAYAWPVTAVMAEGREPKTWNVDFHHDPHATFECAQCHEEDLVRTVTADCASCHESHHPQTAECASCHEIPADDAHVKETAHSGTCADAGCHDSPALTMPSLNRNWCASCHRDKVEHYPESDCAFCHLPPATPEDIE